MDSSIYKKINVYDDSCTVIASTQNFSVNGKKFILSGDNFILIPHNTIVNAMGYTDSGVVTMQGKVTLSTEKQLDIIDFTDKEERRTYLKVRTNINAVLNKSYSLGRSGRSMKREEDIQVRDISVGGICFYSNTILIVKQKIIIELDAVKPGFVREAIVLRRKRSNDVRGFKYRYGCKFLKLKHEQDRAVCQYVFKVQIENHKRMNEEDELQ